jgi:hypothetical protein
MTEPIQPSNQAGLPVRVWGMSQDGRAFFQQARAISMTPSGAIMNKIECALTPGEVIGVQYGSKKARCRIVAVKNENAMEKTCVEVQLLDGQECPWVEELTAEQVAADPNPGKSRRRFSRHKIFFNMEMCDERVQTPMRVRATDISANGCYVETMLPLTMGTILRVEFWVDSEKMSTSGIVRTKDPGVGMGIEFTGLPPAAQKRFQAFLDGLGDSSGGFAGSPEANAQSAG